MRKFSTWLLLNIRLKILPQKMSIQQIVTKRKGECLKDYSFFDNEPEMVVNIFPDKEKFSEYIQKDPVEKSVQCGPRYAEHEVRLINLFSISSAHTVIFVFF